MPAIVTPLVTRRPTRVSAWLVGWGTGGFVGAVLVVVGAAQATSPFTSKLPGSWWFGVPAPLAGASVGTQWQWLGVAFVYAGLVALLAAWYAVVTACRCGGLVTLRPLVGMGVAWALPIVIGPPLMSRDVYAYAAQGALAARGGDPYTTTVARSAGSPYLHLVDPLWRHATSPYGPLFLEFARGAAAVGGRHVLVTVVGLRLVAVTGMVLLAVAVPSLARSYGRSPATAFALTVLNPLLLLTLVGGAHNDALMLGLLVAGIALARIGRAVPAIVLCALAATVKVPAFAGVVFVGWSWPGPTAGWRRRLGPVAGAVAGGAAVAAAVSLVSGWGWRWLTAADPGRVVSWLDPATAAGLLAAKLAAAVGLGAHTAGAVGAARVVALAVAAAVGLVLLWRTDRIDLPAALGWTLLAVAVLGPVVWPWYETWGLALVAVTARTAARRAVLVISAVGCFATIPSHVNAPGAALAVAVVLLALGTVALAIADVGRLPSGFLPTCQEATETAHMEASPGPWISALRHSHDRLRASVQSLGPDQLTQRSYPSEWTIAQVLSHLGSQAEIFGLILEAGLAGQEPPAREEFPPIWDKWNAKDPQAQAADALRADQATLERLESMDADERERLHLKLFGMDIDTAGFARLRLSEHAVHTWDVLVALDPAATLAPDAVVLLIDMVEQVAGRSAKPDGQQRTVRVSTSDPERQFILATGDEVTLTSADGDAPPEPGLAELRLPAEALIRLVYGRLDEAHTPPTETAGVELDDLRQIFRGF